VNDSPRYRPERDKRVPDHAPSWRRKRLDLLQQLSRLEFEHERN